MATEATYRFPTLDEMQEPAGSRQRVRDAVASCTVCGGKYRPAGGECLHEHPAFPDVGMRRIVVDESVSARLDRGEHPYSHDYAEPQPCGYIRRLSDGTEVSRYWMQCGQCKEEWLPGHTCIRQPTPEQVRALAEMGWFLRIMDEAIELLGYAFPAISPELYEGI